MLPAPCATSSHVVHRSWSPQGTTVQQVGPKSIMGTWWQHTTPTFTRVLSSVWTKTRSMFLEHKVTRTALCCIRCRESVVRYHVNHMLARGSWLALFAPSRESPGWHKRGFMMNVVDWIKLLKLNKTFACLLDRTCVALPLKPKCTNLEIKSTKVQFILNLTKSLDFLSIEGKRYNQGITF